MGVASFVADVAVAIGRRLLGESRAVSPRELKRQYATSNHPHYPDLRGTCLVCGNENVAYNPKVKCPGTPDQQRALAELLAGDDELRPRTRVP